MGKPVKLPPWTFPNERSIVRSFRFVNTNRSRDGNTPCRGDITARSARELMP